MSHEYVCCLQVVWANITKAVLDCAFSNMVGGRLCMSTSDAGQVTGSMHGAVRETGYIGVPEKMWSEHYETCVHNPHGRVSRNAISCRRPHRSSPMGHWTPGFTDRGALSTRTGYMVTCAKDSDCRSRCPYHPLTGEPYVCMKNYRLYDFAATDDKAAISFMQLDNAGSYDPDAEDVASSGETGICVVRSTANGTLTHIPM
ncbi:MAG: hypothetical protein ACKVI4_13445 [Actinomycetales bacterium]